MKWNGPCTVYCHHCMLLHVLCMDWHKMRRITWQSMRRRMGIYSDGIWCPFCLPKCRRIGRRAMRRKIFSAAYFTAHDSHFLLFCRNISAKAQFLFSGGLGWLGVPAKVCCVHRPFFIFVLCFLVLYEFTKSLVHLIHWVFMKMCLCNNPSELYEQVKVHTGTMAIERREEVVTANVWLLSINWIHADMCLIEWNKNSCIWFWLFNEKLFYNVDGLHCAWFRLVFNFKFSNKFVSLSSEIS